jgi:hypothetical protein
MLFGSQCSGGYCPSRHFPQTMPAVNPSAGRAARGAAANLEELAEVAGIVGCLSRIGVFRSGGRRNRAPPPRKLLTLSDQSLRLTWIENSRGGANRPYSEPELAVRSKFEM